MNDRYSPRALGRGVPHVQLAQDFARRAKAGHDRPVVGGLGDGLVERGRGVGELTAGIDQRIGLFEQHGQRGHVRLGRVLGGQLGGERVGVLASGGLSHIVIDDEIDRKTLDALQAKDTQALYALPREQLRAARRQS